MARAQFAVGVARPVENSGNRRCERHLSIRTIPTTGRTAGVRAIAIDLRKEEVSFRGHRCQSAELSNGFTKVNGKSRFDVGLKYAAQKPACRDI